MIETLCFLMGMSIGSAMMYALIAWFNQHFTKKEMSK